MEITAPWHETFYHFAGEWVQKSWTHWDEGRIVESWKDTIPARFSYLCDSIFDIIITPFYLIGCTFGIVKGVVTCNWELFHSYRKNLMGKANHLILSSIGFSLSPALAYKFRDANLALYVVALRIIVIFAGATYFAFKK